MGFELWPVGTVESLVETLADLSKTIVAFHSVKKRQTDAKRKFEQSPLDASTLQLLGLMLIHGLNGHKKAPLVI
jgi:hypothetical protein